MKRSTLRIFVFLLLGAIVNVAVAWAAPMPGSDSPYETTRAASDTEIQWWRDSAPTELDDPNRAGVLSNWGQTWVHLEIMSKPTSMPYATCDEYRSGWPMRSLRGSRWIDFHDWKVDDRPEIVYTRTLVTLQSDSSRRTLLPFGPIWPGFAINTVFYAVILWLLFAGPFVARRWRRIRRGLCPKCAYDLRATPSEACPECGAAVRSTLQDSMTPS